MRRCKDCGGREICQHGRERRRCKDCGGIDICVHGRRKSTCKDCGGGGICEHGRHRSACKDCRGGGICEHGREKYKCKDCGGGGICEHGRRKSACKDCKINKRNDPNLQVVQCNTAAAPGYCDAADDGADEDQLLKYYSSLLDPKLNDEEILDGLDGLQQNSTLYRVDSKQHSNNVFADDDDDDDDDDDNATASADEDDAAAAAADDDAWRAYLKGGKSIKYLTKRKVTKKTKRNVTKTYRGRHKSNKKPK